ncbi:MAG: S41 family peptidase [Candidatus Omnitrophica bacterium]|nr:S41 family peptidase [Candidatus Omnitrophota bacterium]MBU1869676.1 S41 family peptidase [Candidatus Omnitrophota bacterium]
MFKRIAVFLSIMIISLACAAFAISAIDKKKQDELYRQVEIFSNALAIIQSDYVDEVKPKDLIYGALKGMASSLDPHTQFLDPESFNELKVETEGKFGGLGIEITIKDSLLTVITPIEDTPAWKAGVKAGDRIVKINNDLTRDMTLIEAVRKMRGKPGEAVQLTILREGEKKLLEIKIVRGIIKIKDIKEARILEDGIGYIRLSEFRESTPKDLNAVLEKLNKQGMSSLVFDLRNNPGGLLDVAVKVTERFVPKGKMVVYTKGRRSNQNLKFLSNEANPIMNLPMVVMINEGSASGSEIVAGCLRDYNRAILLGKKSFGKGSVQTVIPLGDGSALRLTTSKYFTPLGTEIHGKGITPDIVVEEELLARPEDQDSKTLENPQEIFNKMEKTELKKDGFDYKSDNQLIRAVDILKAIKIYGKERKDK